MKEDETANPINVGFLSPIGVVLEPNDISKLIEQFSGWVRHNESRAGSFVPNATPNSSVMDVKCS